MSVRKVEINQGTSIERFKPLLEKYRDYKTCLRDIKLSCLFGQRVQFDIENILPHLVIKKYNKKDFYANKIRITKMKFIINSGLLVEELEVTCEGILDTDPGIKPRSLSGSDDIFGFIIELDDNEKE
jgi:hypothetical protein